MTGDTQGERDEAAVRRFVERTAMIFADWGFPRMSARVLMAIMSAEEPSLTAGDLADRLGVSPAAISGAVRYLIQLGLLVREPEHGSRRDRYRLPDNPWYTTMVTRDEVFKVIADVTAEGVDALGGAQTPAGGRVAEMGEFMRFMRGDLGGILERWEAARNRAELTD